MGAGAKAWLILGAAILVVAIAAHPHSLFGNHLCANLAVNCEQEVTILAVKKGRHMGHRDLRGGALFITGSDNTKIIQDFAGVEKFIQRHIAARSDGPIVVASLKEARYRLVFNFGPGGPPPASTSHRTLGQPQYRVVFGLMRRPDYWPDWNGALLALGSSQVWYSCYGGDVSKEACVASAIQDFLDREGGEEERRGFVKVRYSYRDGIATFYSDSE